MARFVTFVGVHGPVAVNPERVLYAAPLPDTGDCWLYFGGKGEADEGKPAVIVVQVKGSLDEVVAQLESAPAQGPEQGGGERRERSGSDRRQGDRRQGDRRERNDRRSVERPPLQAAAEDEPPLLPAPDHD